MEVARGKDVPMEAMPAVHIQAVREAIQLEWLQFRQRMDEAFAQQYRCQEEILERCLEKVSGHAPVQQPATKSSELFARCLESVSTGGCMVEMQPVVVDGQPNRYCPPPMPTPPYTPMVSPNTSEPVDLPTDKKSRTAALHGYPKEGDPAATLQLALVPLEQAVQRMEKILQEEQQQRVQQSYSYGTGLSFADSPERTLEKVATTHALEDKAAANCEEWQSPRASEHGSQARSADSSAAEGTPRLSSRRSWQEQVEVSKAMKNERSLVSRQFAKRCSGLIDWWSTIEEPQRKGKLANVVNGKMFEIVCAGVIATNAGCSWIALNNEVAILQGQSPSNFLTFTEYPEFVFVSFYTLELSLKLMVHQWYYFCNQDMGWNWFDALLVLFSLFDQVITTYVMNAESGGPDLTFMRTLRVLKMARVLRGLRLIRFFDELRMIMNSLIGSLTSLFWSIMMLVLIFLIFGLVFVQGAMQYMTDNQNMSAASYTFITDDFGSVEKAILALYKACTGGDDWKVFLEALEPTGTMYSLLFLFFIAFSQIAVLNILTAIFVQKAMELAQPDRETQALRQLSLEISEVEDLRRIFHDLDANKSGTLSIEEFSNHITKGKLGATMSVLGLDIKDAPLFFEMAAEGIKSHDEVPIDHFVERCMGLRGSATTIDLQHMAVQLKGIQIEQKRFQDACKRSLGNINATLENMPAGSRTV